MPFKPEHKQEREQTITKFAIGHSPCIVCTSKSKKDLEGVREKFGWHAAKMYSKPFMSVVL